MVKKFFNWIKDICNLIYDCFMIRKYPDYCHDNNNEGLLKFIWGVKSDDDSTIYDEANLHTTNDIDITYNRKTKIYTLNIETSYWFENKAEETDYLDGLLKAFREFMIQNNYNRNETYILWRENPDITFKAAEIPELYTQFKIFVEGYKAVYKLPIIKANN